MNKKKLVQIITLLMMVIMLFSACGKSIDVKIQKSVKDDRCYYQIGGSLVCVDDKADLLTKEDEDNLILDIAPYCQDRKFDILFLTIADAHGKTVESYTDNYIEFVLPVEEEELNTIGFVIDMDNRRVHVNTMGGVKQIFNDEYTDKIIDKGYSDLKKGNYFKCMDKMSTFALKRMQRMNPEGGETLNGPLEYHMTFMDHVEAFFDRIDWSFFCDPVGLIIATIITVIVSSTMSANHKKANRVPKASVYENKGAYSIKDKQERYKGEYESIVRGFYAPRTSSSSSSMGGSSHGGGGRVSSSGHSHGGSSRGF